MNLKQNQQADKYLGNLLIATQLVAAKTLGLFLRRNHSLHPEPKSILFIKIMGIGSVLMAADAIAAIKQKYPKAKMILFAGSSLVNGIKPTGLFEEYVMLNESNWLNIIKSSFAALLFLWKQKQLWVCNLEVYSKLATIFSLWTMARNRFDFFFTEVSFRKYINTHPVYFNQFVAAQENYNRMAEAMGAEVTKEFVIQKYSKDENRNHSGKKYIIVNNTCSELAKERVYPSNLLLKLLIQLTEQYQLPIILTGTKDDYNYYQSVLQSLPEKYYKTIINNAGFFSMVEFIQLLYADCRLLITIDSAPLHYAWRLGTPTVSLWGPTNPITRMEQTSIFQPVYLAVNCSPCVHHINELPCGGDNFCMKNMNTEMILSIVQNVFESSSS